MKPFMKVLGLLVVVVVCTFGAVGCGSSDSSSSTSTTAAAVPERLYVFTGVDASIKPVAGSDGVYSFAMPIDATRKDVTMFTDRPYRDANTLSFEVLASLWTKDGATGFKADPPNVALVYGPDGAEQKTMIAEMSNAKVVDSPDGKGQVLEATLTIATDQAVAALAKTSGTLGAHAKRHAAFTTINKADTKEIAVFVDAVC